MTAGTLVSVEEYLHSSYRPDCDYIEGTVTERNVGELNHGRLQGNIFAWLKAHEARWKAKVAVEVRVKIGPRRFRIPDVIVLSADAPIEQVVITPPVLCIEILSRSDTLNEIWDRTQDYLALGVPVCWIIDPESRRAWTLTSAGLTEAKDATLRAGHMEMRVDEVFD